MQGRDLRAAMSVRGIVPGTSVCFGFSVTLHPYGKIKSAYNGSSQLVILYKEDFQQLIYICSSRISLGSYLR